MKNNISKYEQVLRENKKIINVRKENVPNEFKDFVELYSIRYISNEFEVEGYAAFPKNKNKLLPGLIYNRGGNREFGTIKTILLCKLALAGFAVLASQYRGNCGGTGREEFGGDDVYDVINLIDIMLELNFVKNNGVYMLGQSRGGMMTYRACSIDKRIIAAVIMSGLADCVNMYNTREEGMKKVFHELVGGAPSECPEEFIKRSAVNWAEKINSPILICHGTADSRVKVEQAYRMADALKKAKKEYKLIIYENEEHSLKGTKWLKDSIEWLRQYPI